jgi:hypothetical protein
MVEAESVLFSFVSQSGPHLSVPNLSGPRRRTRIMEVTARILRRRCLGMAARRFDQIGDNFRYPQATIFADGLRDEFCRQCKRRRPPISASFTHSYQGHRLLVLWLARALFVAHGQPLRTSFWPVCELSEKIVFENATSMLRGAIERVVPAGSDRSGSRTEHAPSICPEAR